MKWDILNLKRLFIKNCYKFKFHYNSHPYFSFLRQFMDATPKKRSALAAKSQSEFSNHLEHIHRKRYKNIRCCLKHHNELNIVNK